MKKFFFFLILFVCDLALAAGSDSKKNSVVIVPDLMEIPSNILRFHIKFPEDVAPEFLRTGVMISDDSEGGESDFFLKTPQELWSSDSRTLTVYLNPARVKSTLREFQNHGSHFTRDQTYRIRILPVFRNQSGQQITHTVIEKSFSVTSPQKNPLKIKNWKTSVRTDRSGRLVIDLNFDQPMDERSALAWISVIRNGLPVDGVSGLSRNGYLWRFKSHQALEPGTCQIVVSEFLEDIAGNRVSRSFEWRENGRDSPSFHVVKTFVYPG